MADPGKITVLEGKGLEYVVSKTATGATAGQVLCYDTDGYGPATRALRCTTPTVGFRVCVKTIAAGTAHVNIEVAPPGAIVEVNKLSSPATAGYALIVGQTVAISATAGKVAQCCPYTTAGKYEYIFDVGTVWEAAAASATTVKIRTFVRS